MDVIISDSAPKRAFSLPEACAALGLNRTSLYRLLNSGQLRSIHLGARHLILAEEIDALLERAKSEPIEMASQFSPGVAGERRKAATVTASKAAHTPNPKRFVSPRLQAHLDKLNKGRRRERAKAKAALDNGG